MKKKYYAILYLVISICVLWVLYYSNWPSILINLIIIIAIIYILRKPIINLFGFFFRKHIYRTIVSICINLTLGIFFFWMLFTISFELFVAIISFVIVAISLNFNKIITNIASGALLLMSEQFEIGDLIETNKIQGIVKEINLNYTKIKEFDGGDIIIPNSNVYGTTVVKFTSSKFKIFEPLKKEEFEKKKYYKRYIKMINKIISAKVKSTTYIKKVEILGTVNPENLASLLSKVFEIYEPIFGLRPDYAVDTTRFGRIRITLYLKSEKPQLILNYIDSFLRDILFALYPDEIFENWEMYKKKNLKSEHEGGK